MEKEKVRRIPVILWSCFSPKPKIERNNNNLQSQNIIGPKWGNRDYLVRNFFDSYWVLFLERAKDKWIVLKEFKLCICCK